MAGNAHPPALFNRRRLVTHVEPKGGVWRRMYASSHANPLGFGHSLSRFSDPTGTGFGVVYLGSTAKAAFVETILRDRGEARVDTIPIPYAELEAYICARVEIVSDLRLIDLCGDSGLKTGVPTDAARAKDQTIARVWSKTFYEHPEAVDGILYPSRLNEQRNIALYDRALSKLRPLSTPRLVECRDEQAAIIRDLDLAIV